MSKLKTNTVTIIVKEKLKQEKKILPIDRSLNKHNFLMNNRVYSSVQTGRMYSLIFNLSKPIFLSSSHFFNDNCRNKVKFTVLCRSPRNRKRRRGSRCGENKCRGGGADGIAFENKWRKKEMTSQCVTAIKRTMTDALVIKRRFMIQRDS